MAVRQVSGFSPEPKKPDHMTACTQPGCTGTIVDGYCDVCGSPAGADPFVPAVATALAASAASANESGLTAVPAPKSAPAHVDEEMPTQRIPRVEVPIQRLSTDELADPGAADPSAFADEIPTQRIVRVKMATQRLSTDELADPGTADHPALDAQKVDGEKELAEDQPDGAHDYRTRVEQAELPDDVRKAALCEVGKLERTSDQSPDSDDIRIWLDTILELPWGTKTTDWIDIQGSREVEATLRRLIEPAAGDVEVSDSAGVEAVVGDVEVGDSAEVEATLRRLIEPAAGDVEEGDSAGVEAVVGDVEVGDSATLPEVEPAAGDVEEGDSAGVEALVGDVERAIPPGLRRWLAMSRRAIPPGLRRWLTIPRRPTPRLPVPSMMRP